MKKTSCYKFNLGHYVRGRGGRYAWKIVQRHSPIPASYEVVNHLGERRTFYEDQIEAVPPLKKLF